MTCPHQDPLCPCQDGDPCHYEGEHPTPDPFDATDEWKAAHPPRPWWRVVWDRKTGFDPFRPLGPDEYRDWWMTEEERAAAKEEAA